MKPSASVWIAIRSPGDGLGLVRDRRPRLGRGQDAAAVAADGGDTDQSHLHRDVMSFTGLIPATVVNEPFLAVDYVAWGWPGPRNACGRH